MPSRPRWLWAIAAIIVAGGAWELGAPPSTILLVAVLFGCCGGMLFSMRGRHGHSGESQHSKVDDSERHSGDDEHRVA